MQLIKAIWNKYIQWCDSMGLTPENRRSCAPRLTDPEFKSVKPEATNSDSAIDTLKQDAQCKSDNCQSIRK